jgi:hypothetical protein
MEQDEQDAVIQSRKPTPDEARAPEVGWKGIRPGVVLWGRLEGANAKENGQLAITATGLEYKGKVAQPWSVDWASVTDIQVTSSTAKKVSGARVATMGVMALAAKKKVETVTVTVSATSGSATFAADASASDVDARLAPVIAQLRAHQSSQLDVAGSNSQESDDMDDDAQDEGLELEEESAVTVEAPSPTSVKTSGPWWESISPAELTQVNYVKGSASHKGTLKVTKEGIYWDSGKKSYVRVPWAGLQNISVAQGQVRKGSYMPGVYIPGAAGQVLNTARRARNMNASQRVEACIIRVQAAPHGQTYQFQTLHSLNETMAALKPTLVAVQAQIQRVSKAAAASLQVQAQAAPAGVADELKKLAELRDAGILSDDEFAAQKAKVLAS